MCTIQREKTDWFKYQQDIRRKKYIKEFMQLYFSNKQKFSCFRYVFQNIIEQIFWNNNFSWNHKGCFNPKMGEGGDELLRMMDLAILILDITRICIEYHGQGEKKNI